MTEAASTARLPVDRSAGASGLQWVLFYTLTLEVLRGSSG